MPATPVTTLVLFDIDGTLLRTRGAGRRAFEEALQDVFGWRDGALAGVRYAGETDPAILAQVCLAHGEDAAFARAHATRVFAAYTRRLEAALRDPASRGEVLPGVVGALDALDAMAGLGAVRVGLLTGNVREGARLKLSAFGLWGRFAFGAFGDEVDVRSDLLPLAVRRAMDGEPGPARSVVVGDTARDVAVARAHRERAVGVCTGPAYCRSELVAARPDALLEDLSDTGAFLDACGLDGRSRPRCRPTRSISRPSGGGPP